jgi:hypothetical protein
MEQELPTRSEHLSLPRFWMGFVLLDLLTIYLTIRTIYNREFDTCAMDTYISYSESISHIAFNSIARNCLIMSRNLKWKYCSLLNINVNLYSVIEWKLILVLLVTLYNPYYNNIYDTIEYSYNIILYIMNPWPLMSLIDFLLIIELFYIVKLRIAII